MTRIKVVSSEFIKNFEEDCTLMLDDGWILQSTTAVQKNVSNGTDIPYLEIEYVAFFTK